MKESTCRTLACTHDRGGGMGGGMSHARRGNPVKQCSAGLMSVRIRLEEHGFPLSHIFEKEPRWQSEIIFYKPFPYYAKLQQENLL